MRKTDIPRARSANKYRKIPLRTYENYLKEDIGFLSSKDIEFLSAVSLGLKSRVDSILKTGRLNLFIKDRSGSNAVHIAAKKNDAELLKMICERGVPASVRKRDKSFLTPFMIAAKHGCKESLEYLHREAKVDITSTDKEGQNALFYAAIGGNIECFTYLITEARLKYKECNNVNGNNIMHAAAKHGNLAIIRYCCEKLKIDPHQFNYESKSPLRFAIENNHYNSVAYFMSVWNVSVFLPDDRGINSIAYAASHKSLYKVFEFIADNVPSESLIEGDLLLTRTIESPPITPIKAAIGSKNKLAIKFIQEKTKKRRKMIVYWTSQLSPLLKKLDKNIIQNIINYA